jgi:pimeloyl-ACP methyl ester carboxylesterase
MATDTIVDNVSGRKCFVDFPQDLGAHEEVTFLLNLHGGGSVGAWQREYFPAYDFVDRYRLVVATPSAATVEPTRHWDKDADDEYLERLVEQVFEHFGLARIRAFWLVGHSQGGATSRRLLDTDYFAGRVDGWLSLSGGRIGPAERAENFGPPRTEAEQAAMEAFRARQRVLGPPRPPEADLSFIFATGEHEIAVLPETSPWAERYGAGPRERRPDVVDGEPGKIHDTRWGDRSTPSWGKLPRPGTAQVYVYPGAREGRVIADVVRLDKGHTEGLEPKITEELLQMVVSAPGGKARALAGAGPT